MEIVQSGTALWEQWRNLQRMRGAIFTSEFPAYFGFGNKSLKEVITGKEKEKTEIVEKAMKHGRDMEDKFFTNFNEYNILEALDLKHAHYLRNEVSCLFKINSKVKDYDIVCTPDGYIYNEVTGEITIIEVKAPYPGFHKGDPESFIDEKINKYPLGYETAWIQAMIYAIFDLKAKSICTVLYFETETQHVMYLYCFEANDKTRKYLTKCLYNFGDLIHEPPENFRHNGKSTLQKKIKSLMSETFTKSITMGLNKETEQETTENGP